LAVSESRTVTDHRILFTRQLMWFGGVMGDILHCFGLEEAVCYSDWRPGQATRAAPRGGLPDMIGLRAMGEMFE
jgi:hypothetical protein